MATKDFAGEWCDVVLNNIVEEIIALLELGVDVSRVWAECETLLGDGPWDLEKLAKMRVPSRVYNRLQEVLKECAGHVHWLQVAAEQAYRKDMAWGGSEGLKRMAGNWVLGFLTRIQVGMALTNDGTATYNDNKRWRILHADRRRTVIRMIYIPGPHGEMRCAEDEPRSVLDRVGHVLRSIAIMWKHKRHGVRVLSCNIQPQTRLNQEAPGTKCHVADNVFYIGGERYGRIVYLEHSRLANGSYLGSDESRDEPFEGGRAAILVEKNYETRCTRTGKYFPILEGGQVYRHELPLEEAIFEIIHEPDSRSRPATLLFSPFTLLIGMVQGFFTWVIVGKPNLARFMYKNRIKDEMAMKQAERQREAAEAYAREQERAIRKMLNAPNDGFLRSARLAIDDPEHPEAFKDQDMEMAVMFVDMAGFTTWSHHIAAGAKMRFIRSFHELCQAICFRHGALIFKAAGDGFMAVFLKGYEGDFRDVSIGDLVEFALNAGREVMDEVKTKLRIPDANVPPDLRIGINSGTGQVGVIARGFDAIGDVVNFAARAEGACDTNELVLTSEALLDMATAKEQFTASTTNAESDIMIGFARGRLFVGNGQRRVKQNEVETWTLADVQTERIKKLLALRESQVALRRQLKNAGQRPSNLEPIDLEDVELSEHSSRVMIRDTARGTASALVAQTTGDAAANEQEGDTNPDAASDAMVAVHADDEATHEAVPPRRDTDPGPPDFGVEDIRERLDDRALDAKAKRIKAPTGTHGP